MSEYQKACTFCKEKIQMSDRSNKWLPYNPDGSLHECKKKVEDKNNVQDAPVQNESVAKQDKDLSLEVVLKKLASIGITVDLEKLRNA